MIRALRLTLKWTVPGSALLLSACASVYEPRPNTTELRSGVVITSTAAEGHTFVRDPMQRIHICSQGQPDAAFDQGESAGMSIALVSQTRSESGSEDEDSDDIEMSGRTPVLLMTRELFYRACEFSANYDLDKKEALALYMKTLDTVSGAWATETGNTTVTIGDSVSSTSTAGVTAAQTNTSTTGETSSQTNSLSPSSVTGGTSDASSSEGSSGSGSSY
jgi:hypothetical protein